MNQTSDPTRFLPEEIGRPRPTACIGLISDTHLPLKQLIPVAGRRILLWHSHFPEQEEEIADRKVDDLWPKLARLADHGRAAAAAIVVFGHWHVPLAHTLDDMLLVNPGALASGNFVSRQTTRTVALLFLWPNRPPQVVHVDLAAPDEAYVPPFDPGVGFSAALAPYSASILSPALAAVYDRLLTEIFPRAARALPALYLRLAHRCWAGAQDVITPDDLLAAAREDTVVSPAVVDQLEALLQTTP